jgi:hypothetical protein
MNWAYFALGVSAVLALVWIAAAVRARPAWPGWVAGAALLLVATLNTAAPVRGAVDPNYVGYSFGYLSAGHGLSVTLTAGAVLALALAGALAALGRGPVARIVVAIASLAFLIDLGAPLILGAASDIDANAIQFGEYLTIPGVAATALMFALGVVPFAIGMWWSVRPQPAR